jgi:glucokinase
VRKLRSLPVDDSLEVTFVLASYAVGIDIGGTNMAAGLMDRKGRMVADARLLTPKSGPFAIIDAVADLYADVCAEVRPNEVAGIGIGLPAQVDFTRQSVEFCTNLPLMGVDVRSLVGSRTKQLVTIDNDVHTAALGEFRFGAAQGARDWVMVTVGTGVGGAMFLDGKPYRGCRGLGGEIGHMVIEMDGVECPCGGRGHTEAYVARPAIAAAGREYAATYAGVRLAEMAGGDPSAVTAEDVIVLAREGEERCAGIIEEAAMLLGRSLVGIVNLLNPQLIVIGGGVAEGNQVFVEAATTAIRSEALAGRNDVKVKLAAVGNDAGMLGAAVLALDEYDSRESLDR